MAERRSPEQERAHRRRQLVLTLRAFALAGFDEGAGGHVTARDPIDPDTFWINPFGRHFAHVRDDDLLRVDHTGDVVDGSGRINPAGYAIHSAIHKARPDVVAAAHTHSIHGRAFSALGRPLAPITQDACAFFEDHEVHDEYGGVVLDGAEGDRIAATLGTGKAVVLRNHGLLTVGGSVAEAAWWFLAMDRCCQVQLLAQAAGDLVVIPAEAARAARADIGTAQIARLNFRPVAEHVLAVSPDLTHGTTPRQE
ncbi:class II aldolase/adducin family protein [Micromonospora lupini]|uniref:class II aldolase/adducin family protein n=1 Tax=Micromonospora lupini TaxID=285679 RepID=UPI0031D9E0B0